MIVKLILCLFAILNALFYFINEWSWVSLVASPSVLSVLLFILYLLNFQDGLICESLHTLIFVYDMIYYNIRQIILWEHNIGKLATTKSIEYKLKKFLKANEKTNIRSE